MTNVKIVDVYGLLPNDQEKLINDAINELDTKLKGVLSDIKFIDTDEGRITKAVILYKY